MYCLGCFFQESLVPLHEDEVGKPVSEMREELVTKYSFDSVDQLTIEEVEECYELQKVATARHCELSRDILFLIS